ncbi:hypothetical protein GMORB2_5378 [Geosmithia morbida]|uniref:Uncharacterized protein n=1 Tax=Geosmithia morbida TaxID=1094350 RepID=A0A9P5D3A1_9HYPO|nr:uncharacterized protein GMORB2_5378 [Geosmithia morbida]KAF4124712.1 hypothetical protein GMORB2_5378 [Geosmithia morbida]
MVSATVLPATHGGGPIFEMAADPVVPPGSKTTSATTDAGPDADAAGKGANPWPYHAEDRHDKPVGPVYKPYAPPAEHETHHAHTAPAAAAVRPSTTGQGGSAAALAYRPYRPPGDGGQDGEEAKGKGNGEGDGNGKDAAEPEYPTGAAPHHFHTPGPPAVPNQTKPEVTAAKPCPETLSPTSAGDAGPERPATRPATAPPGPTTGPPVPGPADTVLWPPSSRQNSEAALPEVCQGPYQSQDAEVVVPATAPPPVNASTYPFAAYPHPPPPPPPTSAPAAAAAAHAPPQPIYSPAHVLSPAASWYGQLPVSPTYDISPQSPPPAYTDGPPMLPLRSEKPSLFPQAPLSAPPTTTSTPQQHVTTPPPPLPPSSSSSSSLSHTPYQPPVPQPTYVHPPPLPPRPSSSDGGMRPPPPSVQTVAGFGFTPGPPVGNKLFSGSSAMKWLDKTNQLVEEKIGEILDHSKFRPQQQQHQHQPKYGYTQQPSLPQRPAYYQPAPGQQPYYPRSGGQ